MSETVQEISTASLAEKLAASSSRSAPEIELALRAIGYLDTAREPWFVLDLLRRLRSRLVALGEALRNLRPIVDLFLLAADLADAPALSEITGSIISRSNRCNLQGFIEDPTQNFGRNVPDEFSQDLLAVLWLCRSLEAIGLLYALLPARYAMEAFLEGAKYEWQNAPSAIKSGLEHAAFPLWLSSVRKWAAEISTNSGMSDQYSSFDSLGRQLEAIALPVLAIPACLPRRSAVILTELRSLSKSHWNYPRPTQLISLQRVLAELKEPKRLDPEFYEKLVIGLGLATGRSVCDVLNLRIVGHEASHRADEQVVKLALIPGYQGRHYQARWIIPVAKHRPITLPLPERLTESLRKFVHPDTNAKLIDRLPLTERPWESRCNGLLMTTLNTSRACSNFILRDSLSRACHHLSANPAIPTWLGAGRNDPTQELRSAQIGLSYYLNPNSERAAKTYQLACKLLIGNFGRFEPESMAAGHFGATFSEHHIATKYMRDRIPNSTSGVELIRLHNAFAEYTLLLLIIATAHRKSTTPFFFPWDLCLEERLAFVADKCLVGSEARFVPLADAAVAQATAYLRHLRALYKRLGPDNGIAKAHIAKLISLHPNARLTVPPYAGTVNTGLFFEILPDGSIHTISTGLLDKRMSAAGIRAKIGSFRKALADALWDNDISGLEVAALLGHANEMHPFGPASTWSVDTWADRIRPVIEVYLADRRWMTVESPLIHKTGREATPQTLLPTTSVGHCSYEGRAKECASAEARATAAVRSVLTDDLLEDHNYVIDDELVGIIREDVDHLLGSDTRAKGCATRMLAQALQTLGRKGARVKSFLPNRYRFDPAPIELSFGRNLALAKVLRQQWVARVGSPIGGVFDKVERIAQLAISLIVLDSLLDCTRLEHAIEAFLKNAEIRKFPNALTIRVPVSNRKYKYDWLIIASDITSALALGLEGNAPEAATALKLNDVVNRVSAICTKLLGRSANETRWTLEKLIQLFKPWWFIHQPGALYSIATGNHNGPAPSARTELSLLDASEPDATSLPKYQSLEIENAIPVAIQSAKNAINKLLQTSQGRVEEGTAHSRLQRKKLKVMLGTGLSDDCALWRREQPIIDCLLEFTESLVNRGGLRGKPLRFSSIHTYLLTVSSALIKHAWDVDFSTMGTADYRALYKAVEHDCQSKITDWRLVLRMFHRHLRDTVGAPYLFELDFNHTRLQKRCRSSLITARVIETIEKQLEQTEALSVDQRTAAKVLFLTSVGYGGREKECIGLQLSDFDLAEEKFLSIQQNVIRDLKNRRRGRVVARPLLGPRQFRNVRLLHKKAVLSPGSVQYLFESPKRPEKVMKLKPLVQSIIAEARAASANEQFVFHDLRRTFATKLLMACLPPRSGHPALLQARERLFGSLPADLESAQEITQTGAGNPFLVDGVANVLGHANVDTLLNVYFHGAPLLLADLASAVNSGGADLDDGRLATMLNKDRTSIVRLRARRAASQKSTDTGSLIRHYVEKTPSSPQRQTKQDHASRETSSTNELKTVSLILLDRLLCQRKIEDLSLDDLASNAANLGIPPGQIVCVVEKYRTLVCDLGFDDFEPDNSELISSPPIRGNGVLRGRQEREAVLQTIDERLVRSPSFKTQFLLVTHAWGKCINPRTPFLVCSDIDSLQSTLEVLAALGVKDQQLRLEGVGSLQCPLITAALAQHPSMHIAISGRFSRGPLNVRVTEVGISIQQLAGSAIPDGRDFHRLLAIAACVLT